MFLIAVLALALIACVVQAQAITGHPVPMVADSALLAGGASNAAALQVCPTQAVVLCVAVTATPGAVVSASASPSVTPAPSGTPSRTPAPSSTPIRTPTRTPQATASPLPVGTPIFGTNVPATPFCAWEMDGAQQAEKKTYYTYTDPQFSGLLQRVRSGPGTEFLTLEYLAKGERRQVYWSISRGGYTWWALDVTCHKWAAQLGGIEEILD